MNITKIRHRTEEVKINVIYTVNEKSGACKIDISGNGDFRHHLIEELIFLLADDFDLKDHLDIVINKLKVKLNDSKKLT